MMRQLLTVLAVLAFLPGAAGAQESGAGSEKATGTGPKTAFDENFDKGFYVELRGGEARLDKADVKYLGVNGTSKFNAGWLIGGALGYAHKSGFRFELESLYRGNVNDDLDLLGGQQNLAGQITAVTTMFNLYYDLDLGNPEAGNTVAARLKPFIGGGFGLAIVNFEGAAAGVGTIEDFDHVLAYQFMVGLSYWVTPQISASLRYAMLVAQDPVFEDAARNEFEVEYVSQGLMAGLRYRF
jgi:opacity protein-like surface antigen